MTYWSWAHKREDSSRGKKHRLHALHSSHRLIHCRTTATTTFINLHTIWNLHYLQQSICNPPSVLFMSVLLAYCFDGLTARRQVTKHEHQEHQAWAWAWAAACWRGPTNANEPWTIARAQHKRGGCHSQLHTDGRVFPPRGFWMLNECEKPNADPSLVDWLAILSVQGPPPTSNSFMQSLPLAGFVVFYKQVQVGGVGVLSANLGQ